MLSFLCTIGSLPNFAVNLQGKLSYSCKVLSTTRVIFTSKLKARNSTPFNVYLKKKYISLQREIWENLKKKTEMKLLEITILELDQETLLQKLIHFTHFQKAINGFV